MSEVQGWRRYRTRPLTEVEREEALAHLHDLLKEVQETVHAITPTDPYTDWVGGYCQAVQFWARHESCKLLEDEQ